MKKFFLLFLLILPILAYSQENNFNSIDMISLEPKDDAVYDVYTIGNSSQSYTATRWITPFEINKYETTYEFWYSIKEVAEQLGYVFKHPGRPGSLGKTGSAPEESTKYQPVTFISWYDAIIWCNALSQIYGLEPCYLIVDEKGKRKIAKDATDSRIDLAICLWNNSGYRLPTEAEWEYAAIKVEGGYMGGDLVSGQVLTSEYEYGDEISENDVSWTLANTNCTHTVGTTGNYKDNAQAGSGKANFIGAFDMGGNVLEFCWDWFEPRYKDTEPGKRATGAEYGIDRVCRGGSFSPLTIFSSAGDRYHYDPNEYTEFMGFRIARTIQ